MKPKILLSLLLLVIAGVLVGVTSALALAGYNLDWWSVDGGGVTSSVGGVYGVGGNIGQPDAGTSSGGIYSLAGGFWGGATAADVVPPTVVSSLRANASPTKAASVNFTVTFSEPVSGVDVGDFSLTSTGVTGPAVSGVSGSGAVYTISVNTGSGNGTIRMDIPNTATVTDLAANSLASLPFTTGEVYTIDKTVTLTLNSTGAQDGWILESSETSNLGGTLNAAAATLLLGDAAADKQYRSILSFNTTSIPDNATIASVTIRIKRPATGFLTGNNNPFAWGQGLKVDVCKLFFGATNSLQVSDFNYNNASNCKLLAATFGSTPSGAWYSANVLNTAFAKVNKTGLTQFRLRFVKDDNDDGLADYLSFYSGNAAMADRPQLIVGYSVP